MNHSISQGKILNYMDRIFGEQNPIVADIFLTNYCNNHCSYCTYKRWNLPKNNCSMSFEDFKKYALRLKSIGVQGYILTGGGEPTICKDFDKITKWLSDSKFHWGINTNFNELKYIKPDYIKISLDGFNSESYKLNRGVDKYNQVIENIIKYSDWKEKNSPNTTLGIQMVATNTEDVYKFYNTHKNLKIDYMSIRPIESTNGEYYKTRSYGEIVDAINKLSNIDNRVLLNFKWHLIGVQESTCIANWSQIAINENGQVMYCCHKPYEIIGHIMDGDILEKKQNFITNMSMCDIPCRLTATNNEVNNLVCNKKDVYFL